MRPGALWPLLWGALVWAVGSVGAVMGSGDSAPGGVCWLQQGGEATCSLVLKTDVSREECCASSNIHTAWSNFTHPGNKISLLGFLGLVHCLPCKDSCDGVECGPGKACRMVGGRPHCECAPDCEGLPAGAQVCGSDGATYRDECELRAARCRGHPDLRVMYRGRCQTPRALTSADAREKLQPREEARDGQRGTRVWPRRPPDGVLRSRSLPAPAVVPGGPDWQRALRGVSRCALSGAFQPRPGTLRQQQRYLYLLLSPAPGHLLPGPLHWGATPGRLHRFPQSPARGGRELPVSCSSWCLRPSQFYLLSQKRF